MNYIDEIDLDDSSMDEGLDMATVASIPRPGTSLRTAQFPQTSREPALSTSIHGFGRPQTGSGPDSRVSVGFGFVRPSSASPRPLTTTSNSESASLSTSDVMLGTRSILDAQTLNMKSIVSKNGIAIVMVDYLLQVERDPIKALELCAEATKSSNFNDWAWKARLGKCYFKLGLYREAEGQYKSALKMQPTVSTYLDLVKVYLRLDVPNTALDILHEARLLFPYEPHMPLLEARIHTQLGAFDGHEESAHQCYKAVLRLNATQAEALACLGAHYFYSEQPEIAIRYYERLLHIAHGNNVSELGCEVWNNLGLCCIFSGQYERALVSLRQALALAEDAEECADVWYNISCVYVTLGDLSMARQALIVCLAERPTHAEALNNLGVLELRRGDTADSTDVTSNWGDRGRANIQMSRQIDPTIFETIYNTALIHYRAGEFEESYSSITHALAIKPQHSEAKELRDMLVNIFDSC